VAGNGLVGQMLKLSKRLRPTPPPHVFFMKIRSAYTFVALAACFLVLLFDFVLLPFLFFAKRLPKMCPNLVRIVKNALGCHLETPWEPPGAQNAFRSDKNIMKPARGPQTMFFCQ